MWSMASVESFFTICAVVGGGVFSYYRFVKGRLFHSRAELHHKIETLVLDTAERQILLRVQTVLENKGQRLITLTHARTWVQQILPVPEQLNIHPDSVESGKHEIDWLLLGERQWNFKWNEAEIEPGESELLETEFVLPGQVSAVRVYSYVSNAQKHPSEIGWQQSTLIKLGASFTTSSPIPSGSVSVEEKIHGFQGITRKTNASQGDANQT